MGPGYFGLRKDTTLLVLVAKLVAGLVVLVFGAELLVRGAARFARALGMSSLLIGLTVVAFGTSAPELAVSVKAALAGQADIAVGNVVGSNIFNVLGILGASALVAPLIVSSQLVRMDLPIMIGVSFLLWWMALNGAISRAEGAFLFAGIIVITLLQIRTSLSDTITGEGEPDDLPKDTWNRFGQPLLLVVVGLGLLVFGARWLVEGATGLARAWGVSELVIGLTIVAAGTSMPEAATSIVAALRGERDIAIGNVVGSNIFNILSVLGLSAVIAGEVPVSAGALSFDIPVMIAIAVACLPIFVTGGHVSRWEGALFIAYYAAYVLYLWMRMTEHDALDGFSAVMVYFALPGTVLGIALSVLYAWQYRHPAKT